jgi:uncharacterized surface protein with fasciclin (FAS1) repeats
LVPALNQSLNSPSSSELTMLLPVDSAFTSFFIELNTSVTALLNENNQTLQDIIRYHIYPNRTLYNSFFHPDMVGKPEVTREGQKRIMPAIVQSGSDHASPTSIRLQPVK